MSNDCGCCLSIASSIIVAIISLIAMIVIIVTTPDSTAIVGDFFIKPGEQLVHCTPKRAYVDFTSPNISVYESPLGTPQFSDDKYRSITLRDRGSVKMGYFQSFKHYFTAGSTLQITGTPGSSTARFYVFQGLSAYNSFLADSYFVALVNEWGKHVNRTLEIPVSEDYYFVVKSTMKSLKYDFNITGKRKLYETRQLKNACNIYEHFGNCIINDNESTDFCLLIDYRGHPNDFPERIEVYETSTLRGSDEASQVPIFSSEIPTVSSSSVTPVFSSEKGSSSSSISGSDSEAVLSDDSSLDDGIILAIVCIVGGCGILAIGLLAACISYMRVYSSSYSESYPDDAANLSSSSSSSSSSSDDDGYGGAKMDTFDNKNDPEISNSGYSGLITSPSDIPSNIAGAPGGGGGGYPSAPAPGGGYPSAPAPGGYPSAPAPGY